MRIAVLALQGAFLEHEKKLDELETSYFEIRQENDIYEPFDGIIIPGGESTVQNKLLRELSIYDVLKKKILDGVPVFGTCAGLILLASDVIDGQKSLATMNITAHRNAYGRQLGSFHTVDKFIEKNIPMTFIRAPYIESVGDDVDVLSVVDGNIVAARQDNQLVTAFHPELDDDLTVHKYFLEMVYRSFSENNSFLSA